MVTQTATVTTEVNCAAITGELHVFELLYKNSPRDVIKQLAHGSIPPSFIEYAPPGANRTESRTALSAEA